jgi:hypothetical protein
MIISPDYWDEMLLECIKPMYGFVHAPLLFQLALLSFCIGETSVLRGYKSVFDDNLLYWHNERGEFQALMTTHVDDLLPVASQHWLDTTRTQLETIRQG